MPPLAVFFAQIASCVDLARALSQHHSVVAAYFLGLEDPPEMGHNGLIEFGIKVWVFMANESKSASEVPGQVGEVFLVVCRGGVRGREFLIQEGNNLVGRWDPESGAFPEIDLESEDEEAKVSRKHAIVERRGDRMVVEDLGSLNGTYINRGTRLKPGSQYPLQVGDELIIGKTFLRVEVK